MDRNFLISLMFFYKRLRRQRKRLHWVHPINTKRLQFGVFYTLFTELREDENKCCNYFRMSIAAFDELSSRLQDGLQRENTKMRNCVPPMEMLAITIR